MLKNNPIMRKAIKISSVILIFAALAAAMGLYLVGQLRVSDEKFGILEDGFSVFELGVINVDCYWFRDLIGALAFDVPLVPS